MSSRVLRTSALLCPLAAFSLMLVAPQAVEAQSTRPSGHSSVQVHRTDKQGAVSFLVPGPGADRIGAPNGFGRTEPEDLLVLHGGLFGVRSVGEQLEQKETRVDTLGHRHTRFVQRHRGVPVFGGEIRVHQKANRDFRAASGRFREIDDALNAVPTLGASEAIALAAMHMESPTPEVDRVELTIVDPGWYGDLPRGTRLAYHVELTDLSVPESMAFFVDAHSGEVLDRWSRVHLALDREVYQGGSLVRDEGQGETFIPDVDGAYDFAADAYNYFDRGHGRDSYDDAGGTLVMETAISDGCPNAYWLDPSRSTYYCAGMVTDDIVGHEIAHGVTFASNGLIYQNEPGQLNESFSDVFGELIDLFNGNAAFAGTPGGSPWDTQMSGSGIDTPNNLRTMCSPRPGYADGRRWLIGEDTNTTAPFNGAIRDMWDPTCFGHPDKASSPLQDCFPYDFGGVHSGSGIPNHGFAILTDGKTFNGETVVGIGPIKAGAVWYHAYTTYLNQTSGFNDFAIALAMAATDLTNQMIDDPRPGGSAVLFTAADAAEVTKVINAVELNIPGGTCTLGACCFSITGGCVDNLGQSFCTGAFYPGQLCSQIEPTCTRPSDTARMVVILDRSGSMNAIRPRTGNTRCADAVTSAKNDVNAFFAKPEHAGRLVDVRVFASSSASITGGFVGQAAAVSAIEGLTGGCSGGTALAEVICDAVDSFPGGLTVQDKLISLNTDGDEANSSGPCAGPASLTAPPPNGNYTAGSWQEAVFNKIDGEVVALIRNWTNFGGITNQINPETGVPYGAGAAADSLFLQDFAGATGGHFDDVYDNAPLPNPFPINASGVPTLPALGLGVLAIGLALAGIRGVRRH